MSSNITDTQFNRAVDIVQSLPKSGPVQTSYEEKLSLYALYKQATEGDINIPRPGLLDMLGRAKWDSWNKQKGVAPADAKRLYVAALYKILKKHPDPTTEEFSVELEALLDDPVKDRPSSPTSSTSSYHSSQASPPASPPSPSSPPSYVLYPPDPNQPIPDVNPDIVPPSALNSSHRSLLNLLQSPAPPSERSIPGSMSGLRGPTQERSGLDSRAHSLREDNPAASSRPIPHRATPSNAAAFDLSSSTPQPRGSRITPALQAGPSAPASLRHFSPIIHPPSTPDMYLPYPIIQPTPQTLNRPNSTSTFAPAPPINIPQTLQSIQLSLTALHERLSTLERSQAMLLRREDRRRSWLSFFTEEDEVDDMEYEADRDRRTATTARTGNTATTTRRRRRTALPLRVLWMLLAGIRRAMVDIGTATVLLVLASLVFGGGWRRVRRSLARLIVTARRYLLESP